MKNTIRVSKNRSTAARRPQIKSSPEKMVTLVFFRSNVEFDSDDKSIFARFKLPETLVNQIKNYAKQEGIALEEFFTAAFREKIHNNITASSSGIISAVMGQGGIK